MRRSWEEPEVRPKTPTAGADLKRRRVGRALEEVGLRLVEVQGPLAREWG